MMRRIVALALALVVAVFARGDEVQGLKRLASLRELAIVPEGSLHKLDAEMLASNVLLLNEKTTEANDDSEEYENALFDSYLVSDDFMKEHFNGSSVVCLKLGTPTEYVSDYFEGVKRDLVSFNEYRNFFLHNCAVVEVGFVSFYDDDLELFWEDPDTGELRHQGELKHGERNTVWRQAYIGHTFVVKNKPNRGEFEKRYLASHDALYVISDLPSNVDPSQAPDENQIHAVHEYETRRAARVKKVFTDMGYKKIKVPNRIWASIRTFWQNNRRNSFIEDWRGKGVYINWWISDPRMTTAPFGLKGKWHDEFQPLLEEWSSTKLERTDLYGLRTYYDGAVLLDHVDREATHAVSAIINVEQEDMREDWELEIYDVHGNIKHISMEPGEAVFYESAKCLHGRPKPLHGKAYTNVFFHYRPAGDDQWYSKASPSQASDHEEL